MANCRRTWVVAKASSISRYDNTFLLIRRGSTVWNWNAYSDLGTDETLSYWLEELGVEASQFCKIHVTPSGSLGTYRVKSARGVLPQQAIT